MKRCETCGDEWTARVCPECQSPPDCGGCNALAEHHAELRTLREHCGEQDVRIAGLEAERDCYRVGLAQMTRRAEKAEANYQCK